MLPNLPCIINSPSCSINMCRYLQQSTMIGVYKGRWLFPYTVDFFTSRMNILLCFVFLYSLHLLVTLSQVNSKSSIYKSQKLMMIDITFYYYFSKYCKLLLLLFYHCRCYYYYYCYYPYYIHLFVCIINQLAIYEAILIVNIFVCKI